MSDALPRVSVIGLGYIGLPMASLLASKGYSVLGVDISPTVVAAINEARTHIQEPGLDVMVRTALERGNLMAAREPAAADVFIIAVPTPFGNGHRPDLSYVEAASRAVARVLAPCNLVVVESTIPVGTTERVAGWITCARPDLLEGKEESALAVHVAHCPERVLPGQIMRELVDNDRIVGGPNPASSQAAVCFYRSFVSGEILMTNARTAELTKLARNAYRDVNIAFANEIARIAESYGIDAHDLIDLANHHPRVNILSPGPGVGGHCIPIDPWFIWAERTDLARLIGAADDVFGPVPDPL